LTTASQRIAAHPAGGGGAAPSSGNATRRSRPPPTPSGTAVRGRVDIFPALAASRLSTVKIAKASTPRKMTMTASGLPPLRPGEKKSPLPAMATTSPMIWSRLGTSRSQTTARNKVGNGSRLWRKAPVVAGTYWSPQKRAPLLNG